MGVLGFAANDFFLNLFQSKIHANTGFYLHLTDSSMHFNFKNICVNDYYYLYSSCLSD